MLGECQMSLGNNLKAIRTARGITISQLSSMTGVSRSTITDIENDKGRKPNTVTLEKFAEALNVSVDDFFKEEAADAIKKEIPAGYMHIVQKAQQKGISPADIDIAIEFLIKARERDEEAKKNQNK